MNEKGATLIESLLVVVMVGIITLIMANLPNALGLINKSKHLSLAHQIAAKQIEDTRSTKYNDLSDGSSPITDSRLSLLPHGSGNVQITSCDPPLCANGEHVKQVTVEVQWKDNSKQQAVSLKTMIAKKGLR